MGPRKNKNGWEVRHDWTRSLRMKKLRTGEDTPEVSPDFLARKTNSWNMINIQAQAQQAQRISLQEQGVVRGCHRSSLTLQENPSFTGIINIVLVVTEDGKLSLRFLSLLDSGTTVSIPTFGSIVRWPELFLLVH